MRKASRKLGHLLCLASLAAILLAGSGCVSSSLGRARNTFYGGAFEQAAQTLTERPGRDRDMLLMLMERGTAWQAAGEHKRATQDWLDAADVIQALDYVRLSEKATSLILNDATQTYAGRPYERALLHAFTAKSFFALGQWRSAAVEARLIADGLENLNGFPDDPYTRYVAATAFEWIRDFNASRIEYAKADELIPHLRIDPGTGIITPGTNAPQDQVAPPRELICFIGIGRAPMFTMGSPAQNFRWGPTPYVEVHCGNKVLGRSYTLMTTTALAADTERRIALIQAAKTVTRVVIKDSIASAVEENNVLLGGILRIALFAIETPDTRSWQTLPNWLQVARVPLPEDTTDIELHFKTATGTTLKRIPLPPETPQVDGRHVFTARAW
jgi:uncharacterized protein